MIRDMIPGSITSIMTCPDVLPLKGSKQPVPNREAGKSTCHVPTFPHLMRLRSPLPLTTFALVVHILDVPFTFAAPWTAARKLEMRFVEPNLQERLFI